jgi:hypothetical protein
MKILKSRTAAPLNDAERDRIINTIPSISDRAKMLSHIVVVERTGGGDPEAAIQAERSRIVDWIEATWSENTVRAKHARKIARMIRDGEDKSAGNS